MSKIAKRKKIETETSEPLLDGGYQTRSYEQFAWACLGCGLVWPRQSHAKGCEDRGHVTSFEDGPYGVTYIENGVPQGNPHYFTRRAIRREKLQPELQTLAKVKAGYDGDDRSYDAWIEHVAALRVPKDTSVVPAWKAQGILPNERMPRFIRSMSPGAQRLWAQGNARRNMDAQDAQDAAYDREIERQLSAEPDDLPFGRPQDIGPTMTDNPQNTDKPPYHGWEAWESFDGWGVCNILANGGFNPRGTRLKGGRYSRAQAEDVARRLNAGDPEAFKLLTKRRFV